MGCSVEYTTFNFLIFRRRHSSRITLASGHTCVLLISATRNAVGSSLLAAPMLLMMGTPSRVQRVISSSLAVTLSMQSTT